VCFLCHKDAASGFAEAASLKGFECLVAGTRLGSLGGFAIFDATLVAQVSTFLSLLLAFRGFAVLVRLLLYKASSFLDLTFDTHSVLLCGALRKTTRAISIGSAPLASSFVFKREQKKRPPTRPQRQANPARKIPVAQ
jgi:hypothetical protein